MYANAIGKERAFAYKNLPDSGDDELDALLKQQAAAVAYSATPVVPPTPVHPAPPVHQKHRAPMSHAQYLRSLDSTPRLLNNNIFPFASYMNNARYQYNKQTFESMRYAMPCAFAAFSRANARA